MFASSLLARLAPLVLVTACASGSPSTPVDAGPGAGPKYLRFTGRLAETPEARFGGPPNCSYSIKLMDVVLDITLTETLELVTITVSDTAVEATVGTCNFPPSPPAPQRFEQRGGPWMSTTGRYTPMLVGLEDNQPETAISAPVTVTRDLAVGANLRWERTDQTQQLNWIVASPVNAPATSCVPNAMACVGGGEGIQFRCVDGTLLEKVQKCDNGCADNNVACN